MIIELDEDEWYPVYSISDSGCGTKCTVTIAKFEEWREIEKKFQAMQIEMKDYLGGKQ